MFIVVRDSQGHGIPEVGVRLTAIGIKNPDGSNQSEYRHTDEGGNCAWTWYPHDAPQGYLIDVNDGVQNPKPQYVSESRHVTQTELEGEQQIFTLESTSVIPQPPVDGITGFGTCSEWKNKVFAIFSKHGFAGPGPENEGQGANQAPNLRATIAEIQALYTGLNKSYLQWQYESTVVNGFAELRPRLFLPHNGTDEFARYADIGDWNGPMKWDHCT